MTERVDFYNRVARRKLGVDDNWKWCVLEAVGDTRDTLVTMGVPKILASGKRKGKTTFRGVPLKKCVVTQDEIKAGEVAYELETGKCSKCYGSGQEWSGWNHLTGDKHRPCLRCKASGAAPKARGEHAA